MLSYCKAVKQRFDIFRIRKQVTNLLGVQVRDLFEVGTRSEVTGSGCVTSIVDVGQNTGHDVLCDNLLKLENDIKEIISVKNILRQLVNNAKIVY